MHVTVNVKYNSFKLLQQNRKFPTTTSSCLYKRYGEYKSNTCTDFCYTERCKDSIKIRSLNKTCI